MTARFAFTTTARSLRPLVLATALLASALGGSASAVIYDDFGGDALDPGLWMVDGTAGLLSVSDGLLHANSLASPADVNITSTLRFHGDVDVVLDWRNFSATATTGMNSVTLSIWQDDQNEVHLGRGHGWWETAVVDGVHVDAIIGGVDQPDATEILSNTEGLFRIARTGSTIEAFYDVGSGWVSLWSTTEGFTGDIRINFRLQDEDGAISVDSDRVEYVGEPVAAGTRSVGAIRATYRD